MTIRPLILLNDRALKGDNKLVETFDQNLQVLIDDMFETMYAEKGIGLAAPQIGINQQIVVMDVTPDRSAQWCLINPKITFRAGEALLSEGCLSIPGVFDQVKRALQVSVAAVDRHNKPFTIQRAEGLLAHCIQHELDHLAGKLFIEYLSKFKQERIRKKFEKTYRKHNHAKRA